MTANYPLPPEEILARLRSGVVIPAHPLALNAERQLDEARQRALSRYYLAAGAGGLAVGVHTTQFAIRDPQIDLLPRVLEISARAASEHQSLDPVTNHGLENNRTHRPPVVLVAGICGKTEQAVREARLANKLGYHVGLLSLAALGQASEDQLIKHAERVAREIPIFGFYLQPAVGGRKLTYTFWRRFVEIPNVVAIKVAAFNRYQTLDVMRAVAASERHQEIALYTGNDDNIIVDLLCEYRFPAKEARNQVRRVSFCGGLLGHWACWTQVAVKLLQRCQSTRATGSAEQWRKLLQINQQVTDMNAAIFDAANDYAGCIAGVHEVLRRQGLLDGIWCLNKQEGLSPGQADEIARVCECYPELQDDNFVSQHLPSWLEAEPAVKLNR